nr:hypothetical protein P413_03 [uncultured bacterium]
MAARDGSRETGAAVGDHGLHGIRGLRGLAAAEAISFQRSVDDGATGLLTTRSVDIKFRISEGGDDEGHAEAQSRRD